MKMSESKHPVLQAHKEQVIEKFKEYLVFIIENDLLVQSLVKKENVTERILDLIKNAR